MSSSPLYLDPLIIPRIIGPKILDIGCGYGKWGFLAKTHGWMFNCNKPSVIGVDLFLPHLKSVLSNGFYDGRIMASGCELPFADHSFDTVLAIEILEHLAKANGYKLLVEAERVARHRVIFSTPAFPSYRGGLETLEGFNRYEAHLSFWPQREFLNRKYKLYGAGLRYGPSWFRQVFASVSIVLPLLGECIVAVKDISGDNT
jgi:SAM-dependent methyltransferase